MVAGDDGPTPGFNRPLAFMRAASGICPAGRQALDRSDLSIIVGHVFPLNVGNVCQRRGERIARTFAAVAGDAFAFYSAANYPARPSRALSATVFVRCIITARLKG